MTPRKSATLDPTKICMLALKQVKSASDYHQIGSVNPAEIFSIAWQQLAPDEQQRITDLVNNNTQPHPQLIADQMAACGNIIQLQTIKSHYGDLAVKQAWKLLNSETRSRLTSICQNEPTQEEGQPVTEQPTIYKVVEQPQQPTKKPNLIELTSDLLQIDNLLDNLNGEDIPAELQLAVDELLAQRDATQEQLLEKLDNYAALIQTRLLWAAARKSEADRMAKLAESDTKVVDFLRSRLKSHLESTDQTKLRTKRFQISVCANGGKAPLRFDNTTPEQMPPQFQRVTVEPNREAIRTALEQGEDLQFAYLGEREHHLRIK